ncbi:hypothetical protein V8F20_012080 [Naviculisporaceae sp. PSN 640]
MEVDAGVFDVCEGCRRELSTGRRKHRSWCALSWTARDQPDRGHLGGRLRVLEGPSIEYPYTRVNRISPNSPPTFRATMTTAGRGKPWYLESIVLDSGTTWTTSLHKEEPLHHRTKQVKLAWFHRPQGTTERNFEAHPSATSTYTSVPTCTKTSGACKRQAGLKLIISKTYGAFVCTTLCWGWAAVAAVIAASRA